MRQAIVTVVLGVLGTFLAQNLMDINNRYDENTLEYWLTNFSNGDVLAVIEILLICYLYARIREVQKAIPPVRDSHGGVLKIFGF